MSVVFADVRALNFNGEKPKGCSLDDKANAEWQGITMPTTERRGKLVHDLCAHHLVLDARERQAILETLDTSDRVREVAESLALQRMTLAHDPMGIN